MSKDSQPRIAIRRVGFCLVVIFLAVASANAYTVVMRGGRRVEVPPNFVLTSSTLTYEVSPGVQITLAVAAVDIPATERANGEAAGSFMKRVVGGAPGDANSQGLGPNSYAGATPAPPVTTRTITNRDLESTARRRQESEQAYEARRKVLGLPSVAESRRRAAAESAAIAEELRDRRLAAGDAESYWRGRATTLRTEIAAVDAELAYVGARLDESYSASSLNSWSTISTTDFGSGYPLGNLGRWPYGGYDRGGYIYGRRPAENIFVSPSATRAQGWENRGRRGHRGRFGRNRFPSYGNVGVLTAGEPAFDYSYERSQLITQFNELGATRASLNARWRMLEEEARRAGAQPGWLRP